MKHPDHVEGYKGSLDQLAVAVGKMQPDFGVEFLEALAKDYERQAEADLGRRSRPILAKRLRLTENWLYEAKDCLFKAWEIDETITSATERPNHVEGYEGSMKQLAEDVGRMRYDSGVKFLYWLARDYVRQSVVGSFSKHQVPQLLQETAKKLYEASDQLAEAWKICEPRMISNFYRAIGLEEYQNYRENRRVFSEREWVEYNLEKNRDGFGFANIKAIVDAGGWKEGENYTDDIPRDIIIKVRGLFWEEFQLPKINISPLRYVNVVDIDFSRVEIVYDPRATVLNEPLELEERLVPELHLFKPELS